MKILLIPLIVILGLYGCTPLTIVKDYHVDTVMKKGMIISIDSSNCLSISIAAGKGLERSYTWNGVTSSAVLIPRRKKWSGAFGAYSPGEDEPWMNREDGVTRLLAIEAVLNYSSYEHLLCALTPISNNCRNNYYMFKNGKFDFENTMPSALKSNYCSAYTDDGLYVSAKTADGPGGGRTLYVTIYRLQVNGKPVKNLPDSSNKRIRIIYNQEK